MQLMLVMQADLALKVMIIREVFANMPLTANQKDLVMRVSTVTFQEEKLSCNLSQSTFSTKCLRL